MIYVHGKTVADLYTKSRYHSFCNNIACDKGCIPIIANNQPQVLYWVCKAPGLWFVRLSRSKLFLTCLQLCFTCFTCDHSLSKWAGVCGWFVSLSFIFVWYNHSFIQIATTSSYSICNEIHMNLAWCCSVEKYRPGYQEPQEGETQGAAQRSIDVGSWKVGTGWHWSPRSYKQLRLGQLKRCRPGAAQNCI